MAKARNMEQEKGDPGIQREPEGDNSQDPAQEDRVQPEEEEIGLEEMTREQLLERVRELQETAEKNYELYLRSQAELENMKKRFQREKQDFIKFSNESIIKQLLPVVDSLEKAIEHSVEDHTVDALREGVQLTLKTLTDVLERVGVKEVKALGEAFDPNFHQAMSQQEDDTVSSGTVLQEAQKGYLLNDRLIRPSMVIVSKASDSKNS